MFNVIFGRFSREEGKEAKGAGLGTARRRMKITRRSYALRLVSDTAASAN
jgi:hypothetical protein